MKNTYTRCQWLQLVLVTAVLGRVGPGRGADWAQRAALQTTVFAATGESWEGGYILRVHLGLLSLSHAHRRCWHLGWAFGYMGRALGDDWIQRATRYIFQLNLL